MLFRVWARSRLTGSGLNGTLWPSSAPVLSVVDQAEVIIDGHATAATWLRIAINYLVPFVVASVAYLSACRRRRSGDD